MSYRVTPISCHITPTKNHPVFGQGVLLTLEDEGGGAFLEIRTTDDDGGKIRLELEELELLVLEARKLIQLAQP